MVSREEVESCVNAWLDAHIDQLRGPAGQMGQAGAPGPAGQPGKPWTVDVVIRWEGSDTPIATIPVAPPKTGHRQVVDVPLKKVALPPQ